MSKIINKENQKKLIIMIVIIMLFNFAMPNYSQAGLLSTLTNFVSELILMVTDSLISGLQDIFVGDGEIKNDDGKYSIKFSPGTIFSGKIPAFDVNFINPGQNEKIMEMKTRFIEGQSYNWDEDDLGGEFYIYSNLFDFFKNGKLYNTSTNEIILTYDGSIKMNTTDNISFDDYCLRRYKRFCYEDFRAS